MKRLLKDKPETYEAIEARVRKELGLTAPHAEAEAMPAEAAASPA